MKDATKCLMTKNPDVISTYLPAELENINEVASECHSLSKDIVKEFDNMIDLIMEVIEACEATKGLKEEKKIEAEKERQIQKMKEQSLKERTEKLETEKKMEKMIEEAFADVKKAEKEMPGLAETIIFSVLENVSNVVTSTIQSAVGRSSGLMDGASCSPSTQNQSMETNLSGSHIQQNIETLMKNATHIDEIYAIARQLEEVIGSNDKSTNSMKYGEFKAKSYVERITEIQAKVSNNCTPVWKLCKDGLLILEKLDILSKKGDGKIDSEDQKKVKDFLGSAQKMQNEILAFRQPIPNRTPNFQQSASNTDGGNVGRFVKNAGEKRRLAQERFQLSLNEAGKVRELMIAANKEQLEVLEKMQKINFDTINYEEAIKLLQIGLANLRNLKAQWCQLVDYFSKISNVIEVIYEEKLRQLC